MEYDYWLIPGGHGDPSQRRIVAIPHEAPGTVPFPSYWSDGEVTPAVWTRAKLSASGNAKTVSHEEALTVNPNIP